MIKAVNSNSICTDATRYIALINYLSSDRTELDDLIINCTTKDEFDEVIDSNIILKIQLK